MKIKQKILIIAGSTLAGIAAVILCAVLIAGHRTPEETTPDDTSAPSQSVVIEKPQDTEPTDTSGDETEKTNMTIDKIPDDATVLTPNEQTDDSSSASPQNKAETGASAVTPKEPTEEKENSGGVIIGGNTEPEKYSCSVSGHHCDSPETHAYVQNLELQGCPYCGSNSCPSFYGTDEWGNAGYFPQLCSKYDVKKDPAVYCQECGRKCGDGSGGTCVQFVNADNCPNCGKHVEAWTCHTCG